MKPLKFAMAALLLAVAGTSAAGVPVIELTPSSIVQAAQDGAAGPQLVGQSAPAPAPQANAAMPDLASAAGMLVAVRPQPSAGSVLLLLAACIIYLGRRRRQGFALRPAQSLFDRLSHAPARA
jgi:hypothetical protein